MRAAARLDEQRCKLGLEFFFPLVKREDEWRCNCIILAPAVFNNI
jgi:hypothetical protein